MRKLFFILSVVFLTWLSVGCDSPVMYGPCKYIIDMEHYRLLSASMEKGSAIVDMKIGETRYTGFWALTAYDGGYYIDLAFPAFLIPDKDMIKIERRPDGFYMNVNPYN